MRANKRVVSTNYTPEEIFSILVEQHRLCSPLDPMADETFALTPETTIEEWTEVQDLLEWRGVAKFLNELFRTSIPFEEWRSSFLPEDKKVIGDVCHLIAAYAVKSRIEAKRILGANCLTASVFLELKARLRDKGVDVEDLRPSSEIASYLTNYFSPMVGEITLTGVRVFDKIEATYSQEVKGEFTAGAIVTFRDIVGRICKGDKLTH
jgi:hypothetical protein